MTQPTEQTDSLYHALDQRVLTTLTTYRDDPDRMKSDARSSRRAKRNHGGRWLYELIQNADDAGAKHVQINLSV